jgi:hypothetical protein
MDVSHLYSSSSGYPTTSETYVSIISDPAGKVAEMNNGNIVVLVFIPNRNRNTLN